MFGAKPIIRSVVACAAAAAAMCSASCDGRTGNGNGPEEPHGNRSRNQNFADNLVKVSGAKRSDTGQPPATAYLDPRNDRTLEKYLYQKRFIAKSKTGAFQGVLDIPSGAFSPAVYAQCANSFGLQEHRTINGEWGHYTSSGTFTFDPELTEIVLDTTEANSPSLKKKRTLSIRSSEMPNKPRVDLTSPSNMSLVDPETGWVYYPEK